MQIGMEDWKSQSRGMQIGMEDRESQSRGMQIGMEDQEGQSRGIHWQSGEHMKYIFPMLGL